VIAVIVLLVRAGSQIMWEQCIDTRTRATVTRESSLRAVVV
jgi:hypothetical protein